MTERKRWYVTVRLDKSDDEIWADDIDDAVESFAAILCEDQTWLEYAEFTAEEVHDEPDPRV